MKIEGNRILDVTPDVVWKTILDPAVLERTIPGLKTLEKLNEDSFEALSEIKMGPVKGAFNGKLTITDKVPEKSCKVILEQKSKMGNATAEISMELKATEDGKTEIVYSGEAKMSGTLARMGQRIVGGVVNTLSKQFFNALEEELTPEQ